MQKIEIKILDWWCGYNAENFADNEFIKIINKYLGDKFELVWSESPKFLLYGPFGDSHLDYDESCVRIFYTGENVRTDWNLADYGIDFDLMDFGVRHLCYPLFWLYKEDFLGAMQKHLNCDDSRTKFCAFMVSNGACADKFRDEFFEALCEYKKVDSGGKYKNNIGGAVGERYSDDWMGAKVAWLKGYKFNLCFENATNEGYVTEKIMQSFAAGCVPIYWGDSRLCDEKLARFRPVFNPKAFINVHNFASMEDAIKEIARIDNDENAYNAMRKEPIFIDMGGGNIDSCEVANAILAHYEERLARFFEEIFTRKKQIHYAYHISEYFAQRRLDRHNRKWIIKAQKARYRIRRVLALPKKLRDLWHKMRYRG